MDDRAIVQALDDWEADLCPGCGRPFSEHRDPAEYRAISIECPELEALDRDQVTQAHHDGHKDVTPDPERARRWIHGTLDEIESTAQHILKLEAGTDG